MADKDARIRLVLDPSGFKKGTAEAEADIKRKSASMGSALGGALSKGALAGGDAIRSTLKSITGWAAQLGGVFGGIGVAALAGDAIKAGAAFRAMAFRVNAGKKELVDWRDLQKQINEQALKTGQTSADMRDAFGAVYGETGNLQFTRDSLEQIATAATGAREPISNMAALAGTLNEKFGVTSQEIGGALATAVELGNKGGISVQDMADKLGMMGASAKLAGLAGKDGFGTIIGLMNIADDATGSLKKGISGVGNLVEGIASGSSKANVFKHLGYDIDKAKKEGKTLDQMITAIVAKSGGKKEKLEAAIGGGPQLQILASLGEQYAETFAATEGTVKTKTKAATDAVTTALRDAGKATTTYADLQKEAVTEMASPEQRLKSAIEKVTQAFQDERIINAISTLADKLPALAEAVVKLISFTVDNPALAGAAGLGAIGLKAAAPAMASQLLSAIRLGGGQAAAPIGTAIGSSLAQSSSAIGANAAGGFSRAFAAGGPYALAIGAAIAAAVILSQDSEEAIAAKAESAKTGEVYQEGGGGVEGGSAADNTQVSVRDPETGELKFLGRDEARQQGFSIKNTNDSQEAVDYADDDERKYFSDIDSEPTSSTYGKSRVERNNGISLRARLVRNVANRVMENTKDEMSFDEAPAAVKAGAKASGIDSERITAAIRGELKVRVTNPQDLVRADSPGIKPVTPGNVPR